MKKAVLQGATEEGTNVAAPSSNSNTRVRPDRKSPPSTPRWVKVSVIIFIVLALLVVIIELAGYGFGGPMMRMSTPMHMAAIAHGVQQL